MDNTFFQLLQINESTFPIGGYAHSYGLETYIQRGFVKSPSEVESYIKQNLENAFLYTELLGAALAYDAAASADLEELISLEEILFAGKTPLEIRQASCKLGSRFVKTARVLLCRRSIFDDYQECTKGMSISHAVAYGVFCLAAKILKEQAVSAFLYAQTSAMVTNCVKTIPLSQTEGQRILAGSYSLFPEILNKLKILTKADLCRCCPGLDIRAMQHETLYSRLYMS